MEGIRVVEWGEMVSAPFCAKLLAELGADVVKVEPPDGDPARRRGPFPDGVSHTESSGLFLFANQGKRSITLDTATDAGVVRLHRLLETADVFVENQPYAGLHKVGISAEQLAERHPHLIAVSLSPYGRTGDYREYAGYDLQVNALSGMSFGTGHTHREPLTTPDQQAAFLSGVGGAFAAIVALLARDAADADGRGDAGQYIDVADSGIIATLLTGYHLPTFIYRGIAGSRSGNRMRLGLFPNCVLPCRDGYVCIDAPQLEQYQRFLNLLGNPDWMDNPHYRDRRAMSDQYPEEAESLIAPWFKEHDKDEILQLCLENRIPCAPVLTMDEVLQSRHLLARHWFREIDHPRVGTLKYPGPPMRLHGSPLRVSGPAPMLGEHNDDVLADPAARCPPKPRAARRESSDDCIPPAALHEVRIVDLGSAWAGPMAGQLLADMGAEVIKVESRARVDGMRLGRPMIPIPDHGEDLSGGDRGLWPELQPVFHGLNRNKLSVTLNLRTEEGRSLLRQLVSVSDVVLSNFSPGVLQRLGMDYDSLSRVNPDIIVAAMPAFGDTGPLSDMVAYAPIIQAMSGMMSLVGYRPEEGEPLVGELQAAWSDTVAAMCAALGVVAALRYRNRTGCGQYVEAAHLEGTAALLGVPMLQYQMTGDVPTPLGNDDPDFAPHNNYPCAGEDAWVSIAVGNDSEWDALVDVLGREELNTDPRFCNSASRSQHRRALDDLVAKWTRTRTPEEATRLLQSAGVAAMPVMNIADQFADPHLNARGTYVEIDHPRVGAEMLYGVPWLFSGTPGSVRAPAPLLGQHNEYALTELLGMDDATVRRLSDEQVVY
ncbi:MAG: CoA transferase [Chloroflexota bacterium]|nr:CoA transferase [Chloroflexota bacterium]